MSAKNIITNFNVIDTEEKAYWLGFLYADGCVHSAENKIELGLAEKDYKHIESLKILWILTIKFVTERIQNPIVLALEVLLAKKI